MYFWSKFIVSGHPLLYLIYDLISANTGDFELTFSSLSKDKIFVQYSDDKKSKAAVLFTYNDNWSSWGPLSGTPYYDTNRIFSQLKRTKYRYVHICKSKL